MELLQRDSKHKLGTGAQRPKPKGSGSGKGLDKPNTLAELLARGSFATRWPGFMSLIAVDPAE